MKRLLLIAIAGLALSGCGTVSNAFNCAFNDLNHTNDLNCQTHQSAPKGG